MTMPAALAYLVERIPWAVLGLFIGHLTGRGVRDLDAIAAAVNPEEPMPEDPRPRRWIRRLTFNHILGTVVFVLGVGTVTQGYIYNEATQRIADCTRNYSNGFADAIDARSDASSAAQLALDGWMTTLDELMTKTAPGTDPAAARERFRLATADYLAKRAEAKKQQAEHPYPLPPRDVCQ